MGKMLISAWLAVASGKLGGRSLAEEGSLEEAATNSVFENLLKEKPISDELLNKIGTSEDPNPGDEPLSIEQVLSGVEGLGETPRVPVNELPAVQVNVKPVGGEKDVMTEKKVLLGEAEVDTLTEEELGGDKGQNIGGQSLTGQQIGGDKEESKEIEKEVISEEDRLSLEEAEKIQEKEAINSEEGELLDNEENEREGVVKFVSGTLLQAIFKGNLTAVKPVCESKWKYVPPMPSRENPALYVHEDCVELLWDAIHHGKRIRDRSFKSFEDCQDGEINPSRSKEEFISEQETCDFTLYDLYFNSNNSGKYVVEPSFTDKSKNGFLKKMTGGDPYREHRKRTKQDFANVFDYAETQNTTHLLQGQDYSDANWLATEFVGGAPLKTLVLRNYNYFSTKQVRIMVVDMLRAFATLHCAGYVHGDGHYGNYMVSETGNGRLIDLDRMSVFPREWDSEVVNIKERAEDLLSLSASRFDRPVDCMNKKFLTKLHFLLETDGLNKPKYCDQGQFKFKEELNVDKLFSDSDELACNSQAKGCEVDEEEELYRDRQAFEASTEARKWQKWWVVDRWVVDPSNIYEPRTPCPTTTPTTTLTTAPATTPATSTVPVDEPVAVQVNVKPVGGEKVEGGDQGESGGAAKEPKKIEKEKAAREEEERLNAEPVVSAASSHQASPNKNTDASLLALLNTVIETKASDALKTGLKELGFEKVQSFVKKQLNVIKGKLPDWENASPEDIQEAVEKELLGGHEVKDLLDPTKWTSIVTSVTAYDEEGTLVQYLADPESKYINYVWYGYLLHAGLWSGDVILTLLGGILPKPLKWLFSLFFGSSTIGFLATNVIAVWQGASTKYYILAAAHLAVIIVKILTNIIAIGPLKLIRWILNPVLELLGAVNIFLVSLLPIYHAYNTAPKTVKTVLSSFSADVQSAANALISKVTQA